MEIRDIHDYKARVRRASDAIKSSDFSEKNKTLAVKFQDFCTAQGLSDGRIAKHLWGLLVIGRMLKKDFDVVQREDIEKLVAGLRREGYASSTLVDFNITIKKFYNWLRKLPRQQYPPEVNWLTTTKKDEYSRDPSEDLSIDDIKALAATAEHPRDKAMVWVLFETGARIGELLNIRIRDIKFGNIVTVAIKGEKVKKMRDVPLVQARPDLATWLDIHPHRNNPEAMLWISVGVKNHNKPLAYGSVVRMLDVLSKKAGITKPVNPHSFRHSRLSFLGDYLTDAQMCEIAGWMPGSKMSKVYVRPKRTKHAVLGIYGISLDSSEEKKIFEPKTCSVCTMVNAPESKQCRHCGSVIDIEESLSVVKNGYETVERKLYSQPKVVEEAVKALQQNRGSFELLKKSYPKYCKEAKSVAIQEKN